MLSCMLWLDTAAALRGDTFVSPLSKAWKASATASGATPLSAGAQGSEPGGPRLATAGSAEQGAVLQQELANLPSPVPAYYALAAGTRRWRTAGLSKPCQAGTGVLPQARSGSRAAPRLPKKPAQVLSTELGSFWYRSSRLLQVRAAGAIQEVVLELGQRRGLGVGLLVGLAGGNLGKPPAGGQPGPDAAQAPPRGHQGSHAGADLANCRQRSTASARPAPRQLAHKGPALPAGRMGGPGERRRLV